jgi:hypothetical protein
MIIDPKTLREQIENGQHAIGGERMMLPTATVVALLDENDRFRAAMECMVCGTSEQQHNHCWDCVKARIKGHVDAVRTSEQQLAAMTAARDEALRLIDSHAWRCSRDGQQAADIAAALRKVGQ